MISFDCTVRINRPPDQVFAVLADFETFLARWARGPIAAVRIEGDGGVGSRYTITARVGPAKVRAPYEVTSYKPPERLGGNGIAGPVRFHEDYTLVQEHAGTVLTQSIQATPRGPLGLVEGVVTAQLRSLIRSDLERLKRLVEARPLQS